MNEPSDTKVLRRWPGLLLSFFVPGFGLFRAGLWRRGVAWLVGLLLLNFISGVTLALAAIPVLVAVIIVIFSLVIQIWMLRDGFRPGKMTWRLWLLFIATSTALVVIPSPFLSVASAYRIPTGGMEPTLCGTNSMHGADHVIVDRLSYRFSPPQRGDLLVFSTAKITAIHELTGNTDDNFFIQRLVGMPGETIRIKEGRVFVDGRQLGAADGVPPFNYQNPINFPTAIMKEGEDYVIGSDEYFLLGDNTSSSLDSRYWGCVPKASVYGKATMIYYPFARFGRLPHR